MPDQSSRKRPVDSEKEMYSATRLRGNRNLKNKQQVLAAVKIERGENNELDVPGVFSRKWCLGITPEFGPEA